MTVIPFVLAVLVALIVPIYMLEDPFKDPGWEPAYGSLNDDMVDMYEQLNNADRFNKKMHTFISECYDRIDLPIVEQQECTSVIGKFNSQVTDLESTHGNIINTVTGNVAGTVISDIDESNDNDNDNEDDNQQDNEASTDQSSMPPIYTDSGERIDPPHEPDSQGGGPGNLAGPVTSEHDPNTDTGDNHQSDQEEEEEEDEEETDE
jgi:hypothetical protein